MDQQESALQMCVCSRHRVNKPRAKVRHVQGALWRDCRREPKAGAERRREWGAGRAEDGEALPSALWEDYFSKVSLEERVPGE